MKCTSENNIVTYYPHAVFQAHSTGVTMKHGLNWEKILPFIARGSFDTNVGGRIFYIQYVTQ
jgi:hypothetical protein